MEVIVNGTTCYMPSQCSDERIRATKDEGLRCLRLITRHPFAWPGGYEHFVITNDGGVLCRHCARKEYRRVYRSTRDKDRDGWEITSILSLGEIDDDVVCDHCGETIGGL
jgi:hypothetical protein